MYKYIKYRFELQKLQSKRRKALEACEKELSQAYKDQKSKNEILLLKHQLFFESDEFNELIAILATNYLREKAEKLFVPLPDHKDENMWNQGQIYTANYLLTRKGISTVRAAIRKERKESVELYLLIAAASTGIIGALIGVISVLK